MDLRRLAPAHLSAMIDSVRHRNDPSVQADLDWSRHGVDLPAGLELQWLGTAGFRLTYEQTTIVIDPYLSRAPLSDLARNRVLHSDATMVDRLIPHADAIDLWIAQTPGRPGVPVRSGLGVHDRGRRHHDVPPGLGRPDR